MAQPRGVELQCLLQVGEAMSRWTRWDREDETEERREKGKRKRKTGGEGKEKEKEKRERRNIVVSFEAFLWLFLVAGTHVEIWRRRVSVRVLSSEHVL